MSLGEECEFYINTVVMLKSPKFIYSNVIIKTAKMRVNGNFLRGHQGRPSVKSFSFQVTSAKINK